MKEASLYTSISEVLEIPNFWKYQIFGNTKFLEIHVWCIIYYTSTLWDINMVIPTVEYNVHLMIWKKLEIP